MASNGPTILWPKTVGFSIGFIIIVEPSSAAAAGVAHLVGFRNAVGFGDEDEFCTEEDRAGWKLGSTLDTPRSRCQHPDENWLCLCCKDALGSRFVNKHMAEHYHKTSHYSALSFSDLSVWCVFGCASDGAAAARMLECVFAEVWASSGFSRSSGSMLECYGSMNWIARYHGNETSLQVASCTFVFQVFRISDQLKLSYIYGNPECADTSIHLGVQPKLEDDLSF